jgi:hypothetical protein
VNINSAAFSKINWTNVIAAAGTLVAVFGVDLSTELQAQIVTAIALGSQFLTVVFRTWFTAKAG